jgi:hypothetical protein
MSTSVKMSEETKRLVDRLQARIVLATGRKPSQQEILDQILRLASEDEEDLIRRLSGVKLPLSSREIKELMKVPTDWGVATNESEIDEVLYGYKKRRK